MRKVLLTGGSGFLGSHLLQLLIDKGYQPIVLLRSTSDVWRISHLKNSYTTFISDNHITDIPRLFAKQEIDTIIHTATEYGRQKPLSAILQTNVIFPLQLIEEGLKHGLKQFINTDTFFGKKHFNLSYLNDYTSSKRILENLLIGLSSKVKISNLRIEHVYGENDAEQKFVTNTFRQTIQNAGDILLSEGLQKRDFIYVRDVANAYTIILDQDHPLPGFEEFEVGTGQSISVKELVTKIAAATNSTSTLNFGAVPGRDGEIADSKANNTTLKELGWEPKYSLDAALKMIAIVEQKRFIDGNQF
jgi:nucleoside-diphosphate-sugar epimerase